MTNSDGTLHAQPSFRKEWLQLWNISFSAIPTSEMCPVVAWVVWKSLQGKSERFKAAMWWTFYACAAIVIYLSETRKIGDVNIL